MGVLCFFVWKTLKVMGGRTKPHQIKPVSSQSIGWDEIAGVDEAKDELAEVVDVENNLMMVKGAVPGARGTLLLIRKARAAKK